MAPNAPCMARTHSTRQEKRSEPPLSRDREFMDMIEKMPHVLADLEELSRRGANRERVVGFLETIVIGGNLRTVKVLKERETTLRKLADDMGSLAVRVSQVLFDGASAANYWVRALGYPVKETPDCPWDAVEQMEECAKWAQSNAKALSHLRSVVRQTQGGGINELFKYVRKRTGKNRAALLARLLNAAHDALDADRSFSEEGLKKLVARHRERRRKESKEIQHIESLLRAHRDK
jgi:hypothetical protein